MNAYDTQERGDEYRFAVGSGYNTYYYTLTVPKDTNPREYFFETFGEYPDICMRKGTVKNG